MPRVYFTESIPSEVGTSFSLDAEASHYLFSVLRTSAGDNIELFDSSGRRCIAQLASLTKSSAMCKLIKHLPQIKEPTYGVVLLLGLLKGQKMDLVVQKATELGVKRVVPLVSERCVVRSTRKVQRWRKIALEAARQCGRPLVPDIEEPVGFMDFFSRLSEPIKGYIFWEQQRQSEGMSGDDLNHLNQDIFVVVGPEGGLSPDEVQTASKAGLDVRGLGDNILRAETAAIVALSLVQFKAGRLGG